jgi:hypothetical protein
VADARPHQERGTVGTAAVPRDVVAVPPLVGLRSWGVRQWDTWDGWDGCVPLRSK